MLAQFESTCQIESHLIDHRGLLRPVAVQNLLLVAASEHAERLGFSIQDLVPKGLTWMLFRFWAKIHRYPKWTDRVRVRTWPSGRDRLFAFRDYEILDEAGDVLVQATSAWMLVNFHTKRPLRLDDQLDEIPVTPRRVLGETFAPLSALKNPTITRSFPVLYRDLDMNQHTTSVSYLEWCIETVPREIWATHELTEMALNYRAETALDDTVSVGTDVQEEDGQVILTHQVLRAGETKPVVLARTTWQPARQAGFLAGLLA